MGRPTDTYTHSQFEHVESDNSAETARCVHCKRWQGSNKLLNRKKAHLAVCSQYAEWRAAGNGQDLAPPNPYNSSRRGVGDSAAGSKSTVSPDPGNSRSMARVRHHLDVGKYFDQFFDDSLGQKCARVRCRSCGLVRAKNATRQLEHLGQCKEFLTTTEGIQLAASGSLALNEDPNHQNPQIWSGTRPNPMLHGNRRASNRSRGGMQATFAPRPFPLQPLPPSDLPSLAHHLLISAGDALSIATQHPFLSHAGSGSLTANLLDQWLAQIGFVSRSLVTFTGAIIGKIRIPEVDNLHSDPTFRCLDLLCSAVSNAKRELEFLEATKRKYELQANLHELKPATKGLVDLFNSASCASSSLLEGMVALWAIEHLIHASFVYAGTFVTSVTPEPQDSPYSLPSYLDPRGSSSNPYVSPNNNRSEHVTALRESIIENWKSDNFHVFVEACRMIVDEVAIAQMVGKSRAHMQSCERIFKQAIWLWGQMFPEVASMGGEEGALDKGEASQNGSAIETVEYDDDEDAQASTGPTSSEMGLDPVAAAD